MKCNVSEKHVSHHKETSGIGTVEILQASFCKYTEICTIWTYGVLFLLHVS